MSEGQCRAKRYKNSQEGKVTLSWSKDKLRDEVAFHGSLSHGERFQSKGVK